MNYDDYARQYAVTREAAPWILAVLADSVGRLPPNATVVEVGCGTGNFINKLAEMFPDCACKGFDLSSEMLAVARNRSDSVEFSRGDAEAQFPYEAREADFVYLVDVVHHLRDLDNLFGESARILKPDGTLMIVTDSEANIRNRSLTRFFPEILAVELGRYPSIEELNAAARRAGFRCDRSKPAEGEFTLDEDFIAKLEQKCSSAMRLISDEAHQAGLDHVREAQIRGETWHSCYTALTYRRPGAKAQANARRLR